MTYLPDKTQPLSKSSFHAVFLLSMFVLVSAVVVASAFAYQSQSEATKPDNPAQQFLGTWRADFKSQPYYIIHITSTNPKVVGTFRLAPEISTGPNGEIDEVKGSADSSEPHPLLEPRLENNRLSFKFKTEDDDQHPDTYEIVLIGPDEATLHLTETYDNEEGRNLTDEEITKHLKPSQMKKVDSVTTSDQQFIGTWQAELKGRPYFILRVTSIRPDVVGSFSIAPGLDVTPNGEVHEFWSPATLSDSHPLIEPKLDGNRLTFSFKAGEIDEHPDTLEMTVTGPDEGTIRLVRTFDNQEGRFLSEEEIGRQMKPCHMKKVDIATKKD